MEEERFIKNRTDTGNSFGYHNNGTTSKLGYTLDVAMAKSLEMGIYVNSVWHVLDLESIYGEAGNRKRISK